MPELYKLLTWYQPATPFSDATRSSVFTTDYGVNRSVFQSDWLDSTKRTVFVASGSNYDPENIPLASCLGVPGNRYPTLYDVCGHYLPFLEFPIPIPPLSQLSKVTDVVRTVGTSAYTPVVVGGDVGYYGIADSTAAGLFYLNQDGVPIVSEPYLLNINNTLDVPLSTVSTLASQTLDVLQNLKTNSDAMVSELGNITQNTNLLVASSANTNELLELLLGKVDTTNTLLGELNQGSSGAGIVESITNLTSVITSLLTFRPPRQIRINSGVYENELTCYKSMTLAELVTRGLFSSNPIKLSTLDELDFTFTPYLSAEAPLQGAYNPTTGRVYSQFIQPDYPVSTPAVYQDELSGNESVYTNIRFDPYYQYHTGAYITAAEPVPSTLVYTVTKAVSKESSALTDGSSVTLPG